MYSFVFLHISLLSVKELRAPKASSPGLPFEIPTPNLAPPARKNGGLVLPDIIQRRQQVRDRGKDPLSVAVAEGSNPSHSRASSGDQDVLAELSIEENRFGSFFTRVFIMFDLSISSF